jgi:hypothetical protein
MPKQGIRLYRVVPGANSLVPLLLKFCREGGGSITSFEDSALRSIREIVGPDDDVEVLPFGSLVKRMLEASGELANHLATRSHQLAAIAEAAKDLSDDSSLRHSLKFAGNREAVSDLFREFDGQVIDLGLLTGSPSLQSNLREKLAELAQLRDGTISLLSRLGRDLASQQLDRCLGNLLEPELRLSRLIVIVCDEAPFSKLQWIRWIADQGCDVTLVSPRHAVDPGMFDDSNRIGLELGVEEQWIGSGNSLSNNLFAPAKTPAVAPKAAILTAASPISECEWAIHKILQDGAQDTAIFVRDTETYAPLLEVAAESGGLLLSLERRVELLQNGFTRLLLDCVEALASSDVRMLLPLLKRSYLLSSGESREVLEAAISEARQQGPEQWTFIEAASQQLVGTADWFAKLLEWRAVATGEPRSLIAWGSRLRDLGGILLTASERTSSEGYDEERDSRAFHVMQTSLLAVAQLENIAPNKALYNLSHFASKCRRVWSDADVSIPSQENGVPVVSSVWALPRTKRLLVLGMLEGVFPRRRRENPLLNDSERAQISALVGTNHALRSSLDAARTDREAFYALCSSASEEVYFSYPAAEDDRDNIPTFYLQRVREALDDVRLIDRSTTPTDQTIDTYNPYESDQPDEQVEIDFLARPRELPVTARALRDAATCPFQFQMRHTLGIYSNAKTVAWYSLRKLPFSAGLLLAPNPSSAQKALQEALRTQLEELSPRLSEWEIRLISGGGERLIAEWVRREFRARELWPRTEHPFGARAIGGEGIQIEMPGNVRLLPSIAGISHLNSNTKVLHLFDPSSPLDGDLNPSDRFYYGLYFLAGYESGFETALDVDGMDGSRTMLLFDRSRFPALPSNQAQRVKVIDLSGREEPFPAKTAFFREVRKTLRGATEVLETGQIQPTPGQHCGICEYGELCRSSILFSDRDQLGVGES